MPQEGAGRARATLQVSSGKGRRFEFVEPRHRRASHRAARWRVKRIAVAISSLGVVAVAALGAVFDPEQSQPVTGARDVVPLVGVLRPMISEEVTTLRREPRREAVPTIPESGSGEFVVASGSGGVLGRGPAVSYSVEVEREVPISVAGVAEVVERTLSDERGWTGVSDRAFTRVGSDAAFRILVATPATTDRLCAPLETGGRLSCRNGSVVVLNGWRWINGAEAYGDDVANYRRYLVNHEVGHYLGNAHSGCPGAGQMAPVMVQQTKGTEGCAPNPWPAP